MKIQSISITNIKSFKNKTTIEFDSEFNIIVGPNASGKSNLLDIITICLRKFFTLTYRQDGELNQRVRFQTVDSFQNLTDHLEKYMGMDGPSEIELKFIIKKEDIENLKIYREEAKVFTEYLENKSINSEHILNLFREVEWDESNFHLDESLSYLIRDGQLIDKENGRLQIPAVGSSPEKLAVYKHQLFLRYLNFLHLFTLSINTISKKEIKPPFLFLSPYRAATDDQDFIVSLGQNNSRNYVQQLQNTTSKVATSLIKLATSYFSEKLRGFEATARVTGYEEMWNSDSEVIVVSSYLEKLGYKWALKLIDPSQNRYEITLEKQSYKLSLAQASSGEKEIINYLFGIFALKISNGIIIIDEPELHLHPRWQLLLLELFLELTKKTGNQFIITTHSPVFINVNSVSNLIRIFRQDNQSKHISLKGKKQTGLKDLLHIVNSTNNEKVFFADLIILVEGMTDRLVFQNIVSALLNKHNILSVVEVVDINGKGNIKKFRKYLKTLEIPYYFIADLDYVNEVGTKAIKELFIADLNAVDSNVIKNPKSTDGEKLIELLEKAINEGKNDYVLDFINYMKSFRRKLKDSLSHEQSKKLEEFITSRHLEKEFILAKGAIESYFPPNLSAKDLDNVVELLKDPKLSQWKLTNDYKKLEKLIEEIFKDAELL